MLNSRRVISQLLKGGAIIGSVVGVKINVVRYYRQHVNLTQQQLADLANITQGAVRQIEAGGGISAETAHYLARAFEQKGLEYNRILAELSNPDTRTLTLVPEQHGDAVKL